MYKFLPAASTSTSGNSEVRNPESSAPLAILLSNPNKLDSLFYGCKGRASCHVISETKSSGNLFESKAVEGSVCAVGEATTGYCLKEGAVGSGQS